MRFFIFLIPCAAVITGCATDISKSSSSEYGLSETIKKANIKSKVAVSDTGSSIPLAYPTNAPPKRRYSDPDPAISTLYQRQQCDKTYECGLHSKSGTRWITSAP